jgi:hypothetical protein
MHWPAEQTQSGRSGPDHFLSGNNLRSRKIPRAPSPLLALEMWQGIFKDLLMGFSCLFVHLKLLSCLRACLTFEAWPFALLRIVRSTRPPFVTQSEIVPTASSVDQSSSSSHAVREKYGEKIRAGCDADSQPSLTYNGPTYTRRLGLIRPQ